MGNNVNTTPTFNVHALKKTARRLRFLTFMHVENNVNALMEGIGHCQTRATQDQRLAFMGVENNVNMLLIEGICYYQTHAAQHQRLVLMPFVENNVVENNVVENNVLLIEEMGCSQTRATQHQRLIPMFGVYASGKQSQ